VFSTSVVLKLFIAVAVSFLLFENAYNLNLT